MYEEFVGRRQMTPLSFLLGPLAVIPGSFAAGLALLFLCALLTALTQFGGLLFWLSFPFLDQFHYKLIDYSGRFAGFVFTLMIFLVEFVAFSFMAVPELAAYAGRVPLPCERTPDMFLQPASRWTCFFSRRYVVPELKDKLVSLATAMDKQFPGTITYYMDAGYPMAGKLLMLPHMSHRGGRQVDLSFVYRVDINSQKLNAEPPSPIGYFDFEPPAGNEPQPCANKKSQMRWDMSWMAMFFSDATLDAERTKATIDWLLTDTSPPLVKRILLEPHLKTRFGITSEKVKFPGCKAARHDDHIHVDL